MTQLSLTDFRNYESAELSLSPGPHLFVGRNGQGKTNLVESLGYLSTLSSHRVANDQAMIRQGAESAIVRARLQHDGREVLAEVQLNRSGANRAQINRSAIKTRDLPRYFSSVLFAPEDLALVRGEPGGRRRFLDDLLVLRSPRMAGVVADYERVLRQRNALLKSARASGLRGDRLTTLDLWDERLVDFGSKIIEARSRLVTELQPEVAAAYVSVAGDDHRARLAGRLSILGSAGSAASSTDDDTEVSSNDVGESSALSAADAATVFRAAIERVRRSEIDRAITLVGPHRDDLFLELNGLPARGYASHGESWSFALTLKLASAAVLRRDTPLGDPVIVLDDVFAELDRGRRSRLAGAVAGFEQVLITAAVLEDVPDEFTANTVHIERGRIVTA